MVKSVLSVAHEGTRDWVFQRLSAILLAIYSIGFIGYLILHPDLTYEQWRHLFSLTWIKITTILVLVSLLFHAWIGVWTIFTDYITCWVLRTILHTIVLLSLAASFIWGMMILWSI